MKHTIQMKIELTPFQWEQIASTLEQEVEAEADNEDMDEERCDTLSQFSKHVHYAIFEALTGQKVF